MPDEFSQQAARTGPPLQPPSSESTFDTLIEARVARLEADVAHIRSDITEMKSVIKDAGQDLSDLRVGHATVVERIAHLPSKGCIGVWISGGLAMTVAVLTIMSRLASANIALEFYYGRARFPHLRRLEIVQKWHSSSSVRHKLCINSAPWTDYAAFLHRKTFGARI